jgi:hypothetical protein
VSAEESWWLASSIPMGQLIFIKCDFFLDTIFPGFYTFVNCKVSLAGSMSTRQRENRNNGNQESSSKEASEEGSQENCKEEVSRQRNRQHHRGTPKASPEVFLRTHNHQCLRACDEDVPGKANLQSRGKATFGDGAGSFGCLVWSSPSVMPSAARVSEFRGAPGRRTNKPLTKVVFGHDTF